MMINERDNSLYFTLKTMCHLDDSISYPRGRECISQADDLSFDERFNPLMDDLSPIPEEGSVYPKTMTHHLMNDLIFLWMIYLLILIDPIHFMQFTN